jgi:hypothetical protein
MVVFSTNAPLQSSRNERPSLDRLKGLWPDSLIDAFRNMGNYSFMDYARPELFSFSGEKASIRAREPEVQQIINHFKAWLPTANRVYEGMVRREKQEAEEQQRKQLQREIEEQERRQRIRASVRI